MKKSVSLITAASLVAGFVLFMGVSVATPKAPTASASASVMNPRLCCGEPPPCFWKGLCLQKPSSVAKSPASR